MIHNISGFYNNLRLLNMSHLMFFYLRNRLNLSFYYVVVGDIYISWMYESAKDFLDRIRLIILINIIMDKGLGTRLHFTNF